MNVNENTFFHFVYLKFQICCLFMWVLGKLCCQCLFPNISLLLSPVGPRSGKSRGWWGRSQKGKTTPALRIWVALTTSRWCIEVQQFSHKISRTFVILNSFIFIRTRPVFNRFHVYRSPGNLLQLTLSRTFCLWNIMFWYLKYWFIIPDFVKN